MNAQDETTQALTDVEQDVTTETSDEQEIAQDSESKLVKARCLMPAWDSENCGLYVPGAGPFDGLFEIDTENVNLTRMTTTRGEYVFQYPGHEGKDPDYARRVAEQRRKKQGPIESGSLSERVEASFSALYATYTEAVAALDAERAQLEAETAGVSQAARDLEELLPAKARIAEREADELAVAGRSKEAEAKRAQQREAEGAPAAMRARKKEIAERIEKIEDARRKIARRVFRERWEDLRQPLIDAQVQLLQGFSLAWEQINSYAGDTGTFAQPSLITASTRGDLVLRDHGQEKLLFEKLQGWFMFGGR